MLFIRPIVFNFPSRSCVFPEMTFERKRLSSDLKSVFDSFREYRSSESLPQKIPSFFNKYFFSFDSRIEI
ncbi:hypothetical protein DLM76_04795 [Leptospira yasudae]|nr:hypothetical protein DLM76_04795 [Leptospira yasudae]